MLTKWTPLLNRNSSPVPGLTSLFGTLLEDSAFPAGWVNQSTYLPAADVLETENEVLLKMDLPGHQPESLQIKLEGDTLTVQSERKQQVYPQQHRYLQSERSCGVFARSFVLPDTVDSGRCEARYEHGVLTVTLPKREEAKPKTIEIKVRS
jgi:HSP20 family protein